ncbi:MAG: hypothetical protein M3450_01810 [Actinomycetota bacterium]|nr:hypothetical protein [Actinomycetota bacterium]
MTEELFGAFLLISMVVAIVGLGAAGAAPSRSTVRLGAFGLCLVPAILAVLLLVVWLSS